MSKEKGKTVFDDDGKIYDKDTVYSMVDGRVISSKENGIFDPTSVRILKSIVETIIYLCLSMHLTL